MKLISKLPSVAVFIIIGMLSVLGALLPQNVGRAADSTLIQTDIPRLYEAFQNISDNPEAAPDFGYGGMGGVCIGPDALRDRTRMALVTYHFDNITIENQLKQETLLPAYTPNTDAPDGEGGYFPTLNFSAAKSILDWVKDYNETNRDTDADILIRGHVLVWHSQARDWFFKEGYQADGDYVTPEVMDTRLEYYIKTVFTYMAENGYGDMFYAWDVVNEAVSDSSGYRKDGYWWDVYGSEEYIIHAFAYANQYAPAHVKLFYNDYNDTTPGKVRDIVTLINAVKAEEGAPGEGTRIDGMGMQGHYDMVIPTADDFKRAAVAYQEALGAEGELQVTELDMKATRGFKDQNDPEKMAAENLAQGNHYAVIYNAIRELVQEGKANFTNIVFWGTHDRISWLKFWNGVGGGGNGDQVFPLLFDDRYRAKPAYWAFVNQDMLKEESSPSVAEDAGEGTTAAIETIEQVDGAGEAGDGAIETVDEVGETVDANQGKTTDSALWIVIVCGILCVAAGCGLYFYKKKKKA
jgi:endo-1,4-beta-xylanase